MGLGYQPQKPSQQRWQQNITILSLAVIIQFKFHLVYTWYVNTPWCDVLINKVFSTFPTTRARNTTSNDVFPPGGITCWGKNNNMHDYDSGAEQTCSFLEMITWTDPSAAASITWKINNSFPHLMRWKAHCYENKTATHQILCILAWLWVWSLDVPQLSLFISHLKLTDGNEHTVFSTIRNHQNAKNK